jgi:REP element-mobilizing transposase RayT
VNEYRRRNRPARLPGWDGCRPGWYFVTTNTWSKRWPLARHESGRAWLTGVGSLVEEVLREQPERLPWLHLDRYVVMPDHVHVLIRVARGATRGVPFVIRHFKAASAKVVNERLGRPGRRFWQRGFHDRIVRASRELDAVRNYITTNPARCHEYGRAM